MDERVKKWREKHPKCIYCRYCKTRSYGLEQIIIDKCIAKNKIIMFDSIPRWFCKLYEVEDYK